MTVSQLQGFQNAVHRGTRSSRMLVIGSGKGGVGKTTFALSCAVLRVAQGESVLLCDADPGMADLNILLGINPPWHWGLFLQGEKRFDEVIQRNVQGVDFVHGFSGIPDASWMQGDAAKRLLSALRQQCTSYDWTIVDVGAGLSEPNLVFMSAADDLALLVAPELTSLADAYGTLKTVIHRRPDAHIGVVINQAQNEEQARVVYLNLAKIAARFLKVQLPLWGWLPSDPEVPRSLARQKPLVLDQPQGPYAKAVRSAMKIMENRLK
ncbi:MAG TPA: P-loop NTPase [Fibrobacteraceae bacterium]|nr:P-loop NTPase [Fibrobacteraceae bacterium]